MVPGIVSVRRLGGAMREVEPRELVTTTGLEADGVVSLRVAFGQRRVRPRPERGRETIAVIRAKPKNVPLVIFGRDQLNERHLADAVVVIGDDRANRRRRRALVVYPPAGPPAANDGSALGNFLQRRRDVALLQDQQPERQKNQPPEH